MKKLYIKNLKKNRWKKILIMIVVAIFFVAIATTIGLYLGNNEFRVWTDKNVLWKDVDEQKLPVIETLSSDNMQIYAYSSYVVTLENNTLSIYNKSAKKVGEINISISNPLFYSEGDYLLIADKGSSKLCLIYNDILQWEKEVDGQISRIAVNKNGEVGVIVTGTTYKSVIIMFDTNGKENFKTFLSTTNATDLALSEDGEYLSFIEINTLGATISSKVKTISVEKATSNPSESIINTYETDSNVLLIKIKYHNDKVIVLGDDGVHKYYKEKSEKLLNIDDSISFVDINLDDYVASIKEDSNKYELNLNNVDGMRVNTYLLNDAVKKVYCNGSITAIDLGSKVEFVNTSGWLVKKFTSNQNIKSIILGGSVAAIIYKDRVEVLSI